MTNRSSSDFIDIGILDAVEVFEGGRRLVLKRICEECLEKLPLETDARY